MRIDINTESRLSTCLFITGICAGIISVVLGLIVIVGWYTGNRSLIQVSPVFVPMQFNAALGFVLCGSGMLMEIFSNRRRTAIIGVLTMILGGLTLLEYIMGLNFGIDELFMEHTITVKTSHPGRMAPNTAVCFTLIGSVMFFPSLIKQRIYQSQIKAVLASLAFGLSAVALSGYMTNLEPAYGWGALTRMAMHTSIGFMVLGTGFLALSWREDITREIIIPLWLPVATAIGALTVTGSFWQALQSEYAAIAEKSGLSTGLFDISTAVLITGALLSFSLALAVYWAQTSFRRTQETLSVNLSLEDEIAVRKQAEKALQGSESTARALLNGPADTIMLLDAAGIILDVNDTAIRKYARSREELIGSSVWDLFPPNVTARRKPNIEKVIQSGKPVRHEDEREGMWFDNVLYPIFDEQQKATRVAVIARDITERKKRDEKNREQFEELKNFRPRMLSMLEDMKMVEENLRKSEEKFSTAFHSVGALMAITTIDEGRFIDINDTFCKILGFKRDELIGKTSTELNLFDNPEQREAILKILREEGSVRDFELKLRTKSRELRWELLSSDIIQLQEESYLLSVMNDISEREHAEAELKDSEEKARAISETSIDGIVMTNSDGIVTYANPAAEEMFACLGDEMTGVNIHDCYVKDEARKKFHERLPGFRDTGKCEIMDKRVEVNIKRKDGSLLPAELAISSIQIKGEWYSVGMIRDIAERKNMEKQLMQAQKMEAIGTLAGGIAHDFNNILSSILGFTYLAKKKLPEDSKAHSDLDFVSKGGSRAADLVKQILAFSRKGEEELQPILIEPIIKEALKMLRASIPTTIEIQQSIPPVARVLGDHTQIHQILMNLCTNAYHSMQETGGVMKVDLAEVTIEPDEFARSHNLNPGPHVCLTISDTGGGIDPSIANRIFEPYFTTKEKGRGTGLGLSVVHGIIKRFGGTITLESELSKGTTFQVYLPIIQKKTKAEEKIEVTIPEGTGNILFVDDETSIVMMGAEMLKDLGYTVEGKTDSVEALELFRTKPDEFDLVITDMTMPKMTGMQLARKIISIRPDIPILLSTGFSEGLDDDTVKKAGIRELLLKPVYPARFARAVASVLGNK